MDIVERLRHHKSSDVWDTRKNRAWAETDDLCMESADEIERLREALKWVVNAYDEANPMRTANMHHADCKCLRCATDNAHAALKEGE